MKDKIYSLAPAFVQEFLISIFNFFAYRERYGGAYKRYRKLFKSNRNLSYSGLQSIQAERFATFLKFARRKADYFSEYPQVSLEEISVLPILYKEELRRNLSTIYTLPKKKGIVSKTGGTTGKSLEVIFTKDNMQERFAMLDDFRNRYGYRLGKKTAWFSGKKLLVKKDIRNNRFWKSDHLYKIRYYSTFHIKNEFLEHYLKDLIQYRPEYLIGFPSSILEIAKYGLKNKIDFPAGVVRAVFPTAETLTSEMYEVIETFFKTRMYNQYASSEGAPFIFECESGNLHLEMQSGVFEVLNENSEPARSGRLVVTSFTTEGTPLIRYDIGDCITLDDVDRICTCSNNNPMVKEIMGRIDDYLYSPQNGKINLGNISNTLKDTKGIVKFQAVQDEINKIVVMVIIDKQQFTRHDEFQFLKNWRDRMGDKMLIELRFVKDIPVANSGKFRMVKNNIKHMVD